MITTISLKDQFEDWGIEVTDQALLDKCVEVCLSYDIDEENFVESWMAYSSTNCSGESPTLETLEQMVRKEFAKKNTTTSTKPPTTPLVYKSSSKTSNSELTATKNDRSLLKAEGDFIVGSPRSHFSPASYSSHVTNSNKYTGRTNAGQCVCSFGNEEKHMERWKCDNALAVTISPYNEPLLAQQKVMLEPLSDKAAILMDITEQIGSKIIETHGLPEPIVHGTRSYSESVTVGRICCDSDGRLNSSSVLLEGSSGSITKLNLNKISQYATFPGQIVAIEGTNPTGKELLAHKIYSSAILPPPKLAPQFTENLQMVIACGPFTQSDNLNYQPMEDLVKYIVLHKPHVVILIGPLVNASHLLSTEGSLAETFDEIYGKIISGIMEPLKGSWTKVIIVSSCQDGSALPIFPTPPPMYDNKYPNLTLMSDPSTISISGLVVGITATDSLMHLSKEEIALCPAGGSDRLGRLASHLLEQQSFYPLYPPNEDIAIDSDLYESQAFFSVTPHVLIIPSDLRYFIKLIHGCVVINPERLAKGQVGGSFVRLEVKPESDGSWLPATHISAQIVKI